MVIRGLLLAAFVGAAAAHGAARRPALLALRGGASSTTYPTPVRYNYESGSYSSYRPQPVSPAPKPFVEEPADMSDAERVYVLQQFEKPAVRLAFLRKVYGVVFGQLLLTAAIVYALRTVPGLLPSVVRRLGVSLGFLPVIPLMLLSLGGTSGPLAYVLLAAFTALEALAVGAFTWGVPTALMLKAAGATAVATGGLSMYALTTKRDFTPSAGILYSSILGLLALGLMQLVFGPMPAVQTMRISLGLVVFCAYLVVNTQMMMGGKKKRQLRPTDHIMAAVTLYTDIINIFLHVLASMARNQD